MTLKIRTELPQVQLSITQPRIEVAVRYPKVQVEQEQPRVVIDQTAPLGEIGMKTSLDFARSARDHSHKMAAQAIDSYVQEGNLYLEVHRHVDVARVVAWKTEPDVPELSVAALPKTRPSIDVEGQLTLHVEQGSVRAHALMGSIDLRVEEGGVTVSTKDVPRMGETVDLRV